MDTDLVPACDSKVGDLVQNETEAKLVYQITETLIKSGVPTTQIGIISLYRQQIKLLTQYLRGHQGLEFLMADKRQGRDKECIVISMVRSNDTSQVNIVFALNLTMELKQQGRLESTRKTGVG